MRYALYQSGEEEFLAEVNKKVLREVELDLIKDGFTIQRVDHGNDYSYLKLTRQDNNNK